MGNPFSKDGSITKIVENMPGGGLITAPIHYGAGNLTHASQSAVAGFDSLTKQLHKKRLDCFGFFGTATAAVIDELQLDREKKKQAVAAARMGDSNKATCILLEAAQEKIAENTRALSADAGGRRSLKSFHGTYLRAFEPEWRVDMVQAPPKSWENWVIEDWGGKVVLKGRGAPNKPGQFLRAHPDGRVDLVGTHPKAWEMWKPLRNDDGSWSLLSVHGNWLSARDDGSVCTVEKCRAWENFWLERW